MPSKLKKSLSPEGEIVILPILGKVKGNFLKGKGVHHQGHVT